VFSPFTRRSALGAGLVLASVPAASAATPTKQPVRAPLALVPDLPSDQTAALQAAVDEAASRGVVLALAPGRYRVSGIALRAGTRISGPSAVLQASAPGPVARAVEAHGLRLDGVTFDGGHSPGSADVLSIAASRDITISGITVKNGAATGLRLIGVAGRILASTFTGHAGAALWSTDAMGLEIASNTISDCGDNGILVWRTARGDDGTQITGNRISAIRNRSGGSGQYGNGINLYRADRVTVSGNRIADCAYSAIRANEASNVILTGNGATRIGEVALYVEAADERPGAAGFESAIIANNSVERAATGIVVTNFSNGGRLAVVQGNVVRTLLRREHEPRDKRGEGICVEADAVVSNNVVEGAPTCGLMIGWGRHMRDVVASGNLIRASRIGIAVSGDPAAGRCLLTANLIAGARDGAIRLMDHAKPIGSDLSAGTTRGNVIVSGTVVS
jgi:uncharacterized secreted repeat protein (TIGR03808 family)